MSLTAWARIRSAIMIFAVCNEKFPNVFNTKRLYLRARKQASPGYIYGIFVSCLHHPDNSRVCLCDSEHVFQDDKINVQRVVCKSFFAIYSTQKCFFEKKWTRMKVKIRLFSLVENFRSSRTIESPKANGQSMGAQKIGWWSIRWGISEPAQESVFPF